MYPHPQLNSYLQGCNPYVPKRVLNRLMDRALEETPNSGILSSRFNRVTSNQPQCYAPHVDVTRAKCAFKQFALPKLIKELGSDDPLTVRQAVTTLGDLMVTSHKLVEAVQLGITDSLTDFLISTDPYLRERVAMAFATIANQPTGRKAILENLNTLNNLWKGLDDRLAAVRLQIARVLDALVYDYCAAGKLSLLGFIRVITTKLPNERKDILILYLDVLDLLLRQGDKEKAIEDGLFAKLVELLKRKDEKVLCKSLSCLAVLCENCCGKKVALEIDLLCTLRKLLMDRRELVKVETARVMSFITITTKGKFRVLELKMLNSLLCIATDKCCNSPEFLVAIIKILTNVAEAPEARKILLECDELIESIGVGKCEALRRHKQTLLDVIRWKP